MMPSDGFTMTRSILICDDNQSNDSENVMNLSPRKRMRLPSFAELATNVTFQQHKVGRSERSAILGQHGGFRGCTIWFTGLSGAGKTTISFALEKTLIQLGIPAYGLDGDNVRHGLCKNLGFSKRERVENIRRVAEVSKLFADMGVVSLASFISPYKNGRDEAREIHEREDVPFFEIYVNTPLEVCESRDPKKLYKKARAGDVKSFTGIDSAYEEPTKPDLILNAAFETEAECVQRVLQLLYEKKVIPEKAMQTLCGSPVRQLFVNDDTEKHTLLKLTEEAPVVELNLVDLQWLQVLAEGWATPLPGFMRERQYLQSLHYNQLLDLKRRCKNPGESDEVCDPKMEDAYPYFCDKISQSIPIVLPINDETASMLKSDNSNVERSVVSKELVKRIRLAYNGQVVAVLEDPEVYPHRQKERVSRQFATADARHPTVRMILESGDWLLGGDIKVFGKITYNDGLDEYRKTPLELRNIFAKANCDAVFAFQLRNPVHNGHALLMQDTREKMLTKFKNPMLLLHPLGGWTKDDDVPLAVRIEQHKAVMEEGILDPKWTTLAIFPSPMLYAGPTEVQWHARARLAASVNTYIVGRDPAGIQDPDTGDFLYDPTHGAKVLTMAPGLPNLEIIPFRVAAYDKKAKKMSFFDETRKDDFLFISGTKMRTFARENTEPPVGFMSPKAWQVLTNYYNN